MYSYSTRVCHNLSLKKKKKEKKKYNTQRHKLKFPVSMNYLVALIFTLTALCTAQIYHVPLHLQPSV